MLASALIAGPCIAGPLVTIRCEPPKGTIQTFGVIAEERILRYRNASMFAGY
jgi:hypothetical protein